MTHKGKEDLTIHILKCGIHGGEINCIASEDPSRLEEIKLEFEKIFQEIGLFKRGGLGRYLYLDSISKLNLYQIVCDDDEIDEPSQLVSTTLLKSNLRNILPVNRHLDISYLRIDKIAKI